MTDNQKGFLLYLDNYELIEDLTSEEKGQWIEAVFLYKREGKITEFPKGSLLKTAFKVTKNQLDRDSQAWEESRSRRAEAGKKGGLKRASNAKQKKAEPPTGTPVGIPTTAKTSTDRYTQVRLDKVSIDKNSIYNNCPEPEELSQDHSGILLPLIDKTDYNVPLSKITKWSEAYPAVDVDQELKKMTAWLTSNPTKKKTRKGIDRFINNWLAREQDKGGTQKQVKKQNNFTNFDQRQYDYSELEKELLGKGGTA